MRPRLSRTSPGGRWPRVACGRPHAASSAARPPRSGSRSTPWSGRASARHPEQLADRGLCALGAARAMPELSPCAAAAIMIRSATRPSSKLSVSTPQLEGHQITPARPRCAACMVPASAIRRRVSGSVTTMNVQGWRFETLPVQRAASRMSCRASSGTGSGRKSRVWRTRRMRWTTADGSGWLPEDWLWEDRLVASGIAASVRHECRCPRRPSS